VPERHTPEIDTREEIMRRHEFIAAVLAAGVVAFSASYARAQEFTARLTGFEELGALNNQTGAVLSDGTSTLKLHLDTKAGTADYTLTYSNVGNTPPLTGTVTQAHIHFGKARDAGGVMVFFCTNLNNGPAGTPACPPHSATLTGTFTKANVVAIPTQNVVVNDFDAFEDALTSDTAYANIHTTALGAGEIRGQIHAVEREEEHERGK
jgi:hypothetical protein